MSTKFNNLYTQKIFELIVPLLGELMTYNVLKIQTKKIGKSEDSLELSDLPKLAEEIKTGLTIFLGSDASSTIASKIIKII
jgi:hypothetical protein